MTIITPGALAAREAIRRGIKWLTENASPGWELRLLAFSEDGRARCVAHDQHSDGCVLALAFGERRELLRLYGGHRVTYAMVVRHFKLTQNNVEMLGFVDQPGVSDNAFDKMWEHELFRHLAARYIEQQEHTTA